MKVIRLAVRHIIGYFQNNGLILVLFSLGAILSSFVFIFFYGNSMQGKIHEAENDFNYRTYEVWFESPRVVTIEELYALDAFPLAIFSLTGPIEIPPEYRAKVYEELKLYVVASWGNEGVLDESIQRLQDLTGDGMLLPKAYGENITEFTLGDVSLPVIGQSENPSAFFVTVNTYLKYYQAEMIQYGFNDQLSIDDAQGVEQILRATFPDATYIVTPDFYKQLDWQTDAPTLIRISVLYIVSLVSFLFLFKYLIDQTRSENIVYNLVGAKKRTVFQILITEILLLSVLASVLAIALHKLFYDSVFSKLNITTAYISYTWKDYLLILLVTAGLSLLAALPFLFSYRHKSVKIIKDSFGG